MARTRLLAAAFLLIATAAACAAADEPVGAMFASSSAASQEARLAQMESELSDLKARLNQQSACGPCGDSGDCQCCPSCGGAYAGYAFVFAKTYFKESFQASSISLVDGSSSLIPFSYDYEMTPRVWLGYKNADGLGIRASYWQYDHSGNPLTLTDPTTVRNAHAITVIFPATITAIPGQSLFVQNGLRLNALDLEGTQDITVGKFSVVGSGGIRYANLNQHFGAVVLDGVGATNALLNWSRRFEGVGPTVAAELRRPVGDAGLAFVAAGRGALLYGKKNMDRVVVNPSDPITPAPTISLRDASEVVGCGILEIGAEWRRQLASYGSLFVRGMYEGQLWADGGAPTLTFLGFEGFSFALGFSR